MSRSEIDLANNALGYLVRDTIRTLDGPAPAQIHTKQNIELALHTILCEWDWPCARVFGPLTEAPSVPKGDWSYAYIKPSDALKIWRLGDLRARRIIVWEEAMSTDLTSNRTYIFTNEASASARYTSSRVTIERLTANVFSLVGLKLAELCCMPLLKDAKMHRYLAETYKLELSKAKTLVAMAEPEVYDTEVIPELIQARQS